MLADLASSLGKENISIASMIQREASQTGKSPDSSDKTADGSTPFVSLVIMTHSASAGSMERAVATIEQFDATRAKPVHFRVLGAA